MAHNINSEGHLEIETNPVWTRALKTASDNLLDSIGLIAKWDPQEPTLEYPPIPEWLNVDALEIALDMSRVAVRRLEMVIEAARAVAAMEREDTECVACVDSGCEECEEE